MAILANTLSITQKIIEIENPSMFNWSSVYSSIVRQIKKINNSYLLQLNLIKTSKSKLFFNVVFIQGLEGLVKEPFLPSEEISFLNNQTIAIQDVCCLIVPTGIGAKFGGYAGDANPIAKLLASTYRYLLTHPNVVNGAVLSDLPSNLIYLEGFLLDQFLLGKISLTPSSQNKIGVIFDKGIQPERLEYEINVLNALKAFYGCEIVGWTITEKPLNCQAVINEYGFSTGVIPNLYSLLQAGFKLKDAGATAIAICSAILDVDSNKDYIKGKGIDPIGGVESIISRTVSAACGLVSAHAPVLVTTNIHDKKEYSLINEEQRLEKMQQKINYKDISPIAASEYIAETFLVSVISGLRFAPKIIDSSQAVSFSNLQNIILPYNGFGNPGVLYLSRYFKNIFLVRENKTCLDVKPTDLNINFKVVDSYKDLIDLTKLKELGIDPRVLERPVARVEELPKKATSLKLQASRK